MSTRDETAGTVSVGFSVDWGPFTISVSKSGEQLTVAGKGIGAGGGADVDLPGLGLIGVSGDLPSLPIPQGGKIAYAFDILGKFIPGISPISTIIDIFKLIQILPGWYSPVYLYPGISDDDGSALFGGNAEIVGLGAGVGVEFSVSSIIFWDTKNGKKAFVYTAGFDFLSSASVGASFLHYKLNIVSDSNA
ncbi:MAG TPA: hypothetical protein VND95_01720 [Stellaceae bacterium]|nr:hypothetical protein [Stellaceae bacterium]